MKVCVTLNRGRKRISRSVRFTGHVKRVRIECRSEIIIT
jgi:hypothetical protein